SAKTNRAMQLCQGKTTFKDLQALARGCLMIPTERLDWTKQFVTGLCKAFEKLQKMPELHYPRKELFHLRDFVYLLKFLPRGKKDPFSPQRLYHGLQRNFNGVPKQTFDEIVKLFFTEIQEAIGPDRKFRIPTNTQSYLSILKESINDRLLDGEDPNHAPFR